MPKYSTPRDFFNKELAKGDDVIYTTNAYRGRSPTFRLGKVSYFQSGMVMLMDYTDERSVKRVRPERVIKRDSL